MNRVLWLARLLRAEGLAGVTARARDRADERAWRRSFPLRADGRAGPRGDVPVLLVSSAAPAVRLGGVQAQLGSRLAVMEVPWALLHPEAGRYRLIAQSGARRSAWHRAATAPPPRAALDDEEFEAAVRWALALTGARAVQVEGTADLPLATILRLARALPVVLAVHDFSLFCVRAHLLEQPVARFCGWCRDADRCTRCLRADGEGVDAEGLAERRSIAAALLEAAAAVIFPSEFLRTCYAELHPPVAAVPRAVIAPAPPVGPPVPSRWSRRSAGDGPHVAFVGAAQAHKGAGLFESMVCALRAVAASARFGAYGGGDPATLVRWRRLGIVVHGYYRAGTLPARLVRDEVDVVVLPSVVPESYGLVLSECRRAGVPVVAFDRGAIAERVRAGGGGRLVPCPRGADGLAEAVASLLVDQETANRHARSAAFGDHPVAPDADARDAVAAWDALHRSLGLAAERSS